MRRKFFAAAMMAALCSALMCGCSSQNGNHAGTTSRSQNQSDTDAYTSDNDGNQYGGDMQSALSSIGSATESAAGSVASGIGSMVSGFGR